MINWLKKLFGISDEPISNCMDENKQEDFFEEIICEYSLPKGSRIIFDDILGLNITRLITVNYTSMLTGKITRCSVSKWKYGNGSKKIESVFGRDICVDGNRINPTNLNLIEQYKILKCPICGSTKYDYTTNRQSKFIIHKKSCPDNPNNMYSTSTGY